MSTPYQVDIAGLGKSYNGKPVLGPIDLSITAGAITAIIGRSGCGKTTLLRCLGGLEAPDGGSIRIAGGNANPRDIGYVFQEPRLMPWLTVEQNIGFGLTGNKNTRKAAIAEALELVGLAAAARQLPKQISGGMAQRTALARALAPRPALILLDEPFSALDPFTREQMQDHLLHLQHHYGATMVLITHDMDEALALADRVIVLEGPPGIIAGDFAPDLPHPADRTSSQFFTWKRRLHNMLSGRQNPPSEPVPSPQQAA
jgi:sulfonate transport system ATP-binding protein